MSCPMPCACASEISVQRSNGSWGARLSERVTCSGIVASTAGGGGGGGGGGVELGLLVRHHGVLAAKPGIIGSSWFAPFSMFVMAELSCPSEFKYHSWSTMPEKRQFPSRQPEGFGVVLSPVSLRHACRMRKRSAALLRSHEEPPQIIIIIIMITIK